MKIARIVLRVSDLETSTAFWSVKVGFQVVYAGGPFTFLDGGDVQLVLNHVDDVPGQESLTEVVIESEDFPTDHRLFVERGVPFEVEPRPVTSGGDRELMAAHFRDPDGNLASLTGWVAKSA